MAGWWDIDLRSIDVAAGASNACALRTSGALIGMPNEVDDHGSAARMS